MTSWATKRCANPNCREKPLNEFGLCHGRKDGLNKYCRTCAKGKNQRWLESNKDKARASARVNSKNWRERSPENHKKMLANGLVAKHIARGKMSRPETCPLCEVSSEKHRIEMHHPSYDQPTEVWPMCRKCHVELHDAIRTMEGGL